MKPKQKKLLKRKAQGILGDIYNGVTGFLDNTVRKGETHIPQLQFSKSSILPIKIGMAQYAGPGTDIVGRLRDKVKPINEIDKISQLHDINYTLNNNKQGIRDADWRMVKTGAKSAVSNLLKGNVTDFINSGIGSLGILGKLTLEQAGISAYKPENINLSQSDRKMLEDKQKELISEGYGMKKRKGRGKGKKKK